MTGRRPFFRPHLAFSSEASRGSASPANASSSSAATADDRGLTADQTRRFRELMLPHMDGAYNLARYLARDPTAAEDIVQDAFLRAFRAFSAFRGGPPKAWLFAIVRNCFLDWAAAERNAAKVLVEEGALSQREASALANVADPDQATPEQTLQRRREAETVRAVIENLPEPFRETLVLREMEDMSYKEIALLTGTPIGTVMSRLARARQMLSDLLIPHRESQGLAKGGEAKS
jgi:RNA polymerase sigma-70 factor (ECF subfamily)